MTRDLIGMTLKEAEDRLKGLGVVYDVVNNRDSLEESDCILVTSIRERGGKLELVVSWFKCNTN